MSDLANKKCFVCEVGGLPLSKEESDKFWADVKDWEISDDYKKINKNFKFKDYASAFYFVSQVSVLAEREGHHPDIRFGWGYAEVTLTTHAVQGLSENDFILAAKLDKLGV